MSPFDPQASERIPYESCIVRGPPCPHRTRRFAETGQIQRDDPERLAQTIDHGSHRFDAATPAVKHNNGWTRTGVQDPGSLSCSLDARCCVHIWSTSIPNLDKSIDPDVLGQEPLGMADPETGVKQGPYNDLHRAAGTMILVRWCAVPWVLLQILGYEIPYPPGYKRLAFVFLTALVIGNAVLHILRRGPRGVELSRPIAVAGLALDVVVLSAFVWLYAFDYQTQIWAVLFIAPLEGAILFQLPGAVGVWGVIAVGYAARDVWAADRYGNPLLWNSITFRMGVGGIIALVAGLMARDLLRQRTKLADALDEVRRVDRMRSGLVSMLGHDVRSPLTVIRGVVTTLLTRGDRVASEDRQKLLESADRQARRLEALATDLLDLARLDEGRLELDVESVDLAQLVSEALTYVEGGEDIETGIEEGLMVRADPRRLEQVVINLATNALRHGELPVSITGRREGGRVTLQITDRGEGVPEQEIVHLFEPFNAARKSGSIGYGLAIVKALVEAQEGQVLYSSGPQGGARFSVILPSGQQAPAP